jgi:4-diphosphocytidyl-2-C-methyl-D-erythritol kinase
MVNFPNCKINLGLNIIGKRADGYHDLETLFYPIAIKDVLEIIEADKTEFTISGNEIDVPIKENICIQAYQLLKNRFPDLPAAKIHLHKIIPSGAGLGGGSADASFALKLLNEKFQLNLTIQKLIEYALELGSDCPFFILNKPCLATGRGEQLEEIDLDLSDYKIVIVNPGIHINTAWAFTELSGRLQRSDHYKTIKHIIQQPIETWKTELKNDFEVPVFNKYPEIKSIKETLYNNGAIYAAMSGSGSTVFGIFKKKTEVLLSFPKNYFVKELVS